MYSNLILAATSPDYGPLAGTVGMVTTVFAAIAAITFTWAGKFKKWRPPVETLGEVVPKLIGVFSAILVSYSWWIGSRESEGTLWRYVTWSGILGLIVFLLYAFLLMVTGVEVEKFAKDDSIEITKSVGGLWRTEASKKEQKKKKLSTQEFFKHKGFQHEHMWSRPSLALNAVTLFLLFLVFVSSTTFTVGTLGVLLQVGMTKQATRPQ